MNLLLDVHHHKTSVLNLMLSSKIFIRQYLNFLHRGSILGNLFNPLRDVYGKWCGTCVSIRPQ